MDKGEVLFKGQNVNIEEIIEKIIDYKDDKGVHYLSKFNLQYLISIIEKDKIFLLEKKFADYDKKGVDVVDFVRIFLDIIEHQENETLYLVMILVDFFRIISENLNMKTYLKYVDVTNYICESYGENDIDKYILPTKKLPEQKKFNIEQEGIREIDVNAPIIYGENEENIRRLVKSKLITDSTHHNNHQIKEGHYGKDIKKLFTLDSLSDKINVYNLDCKQGKPITLNTKQDKNKREIIILSFAWSNKQQRIGATLKDCSLVFWDYHDNFKEQKLFNTSNHVPEYQSNIWYIEYLDVWITSEYSNKTSNNNGIVSNQQMKKSHQNNNENEQDNKNQKIGKTKEKNKKLLYDDEPRAINLWDLETEGLRLRIKNDKIRGDIIDIVEIRYMCLVAVASLDKQITIWDLLKEQCKIMINLEQGGIHSLRFFNSYQVLISAGYENNISIFQIDPIFLDDSLVGKLKGHNSMVTAITCIEKTPMILSADDTGIIKIWDIRSFKCIQTVDVGSKTIITKLIDVEGMSKICFLGSRVNYMDFDEQLDLSKKTRDEMYPIRVEYNYMNDELIVCTRKDLRFIDLITGRVKKVYNGLLKNPDDEITIFRSVEQNKKFIIGDHRGQLNMFSYNNGELIKNLINHSNEVSCFKLDYANQLYVSAGWDSNLQVQKETKNGFELIKLANNCFYNKEIHLMELSVYHNIIVTTSNCNLIYLWDYEYFKLLKCIELQKNEEPTCITFINGYSILLIGTNKNKIYIIHFEIKDQNISILLISLIDLANLVDKKMVSDSQQQLSKENISTKEKSQNNNQQEDYDDQKNFIIPNKLLIDLSYNNNSTHPDECNLYISLIKGDICVYDLIDLFKIEDYKIELQPHANKRMNYNANRSNYNPETYQKNPQQNDFAVLVQRNLKNKKEEIYESKIKNLQHYQMKLFKQRAHNETITTIQIIQLREKSLLSSSLDFFIKIWDLDCNVLAKLNINHPLPILWSVQIDIIKRTRKNILFAFKIVELIFRRHKKQILLSGERLINLNNFLSSLATISQSTTKNDQKQRFKQITQSKFNQDQDSPFKKKKSLLLMSDEYDKKDLQYEKIQNIFKREIMGKSLKEMNANKSVQQAQKQWKLQEEQAESLEEKYNISHQKYEDAAFFKEKDPLAFFEPDYREKILSKINDEDMSEVIDKFKERLDGYIKKVRNGVKTNPEYTFCYTKTKNKDNSNNNRDNSNYHSILKSKQFAKKLIDNTLIQDQQIAPGNISSLSNLKSNQKTRINQNGDFKNQNISEFLQTADNSQEQYSILKQSHHLPSLSLRQIQMHNVSKSSNNLGNSSFNLYEYANLKNYLNINQNILSQSQSRILLNNQEERQQFQSILKNLGKRLKKSQMNYKNILITGESYHQDYIFQDNDQTLDSDLSLKKYKLPKIYNNQNENLSPNQKEEEEIKLQNQFEKQIDQYIKQSFAKAEYKFQKDVEIQKKRRNSISISQ